MKRNYAKALMAGTLLAALVWGADKPNLFAQQERAGNVTRDESMTMKIVEPSAAVKAAVAKLESALRAKDVDRLGGLLFDENEFAEYYKKQSGAPMDDNVASMFRQKRMEIKAKCGELAGETVKISLGECREKEGDHGIVATFAQVKIASSDAQGVLTLVLIPHNNEMKLVMLDS
ncbi:MAG: hypothetical protein NZ534_07815, partial [Bacteroidia bacterium]|nr:hypothetical protein [Bacteroidia bacterium]